MNTSKLTNRSPRQTKERHGSLHWMLLWTACAAPTELIQTPCANLQGLKHTKRRMSQRRLPHLERTEERRVGKECTTLCVRERHRTKDFPAIQLKLSGRSSTSIRVGVEKG